MSAEQHTLNQYSVRGHSQFTLLFLTITSAMMGTYFGLYSLVFSVFLSTFRKFGEVKKDVAFARAIAGNFPEFKVILISARKNLKIEEKDADLFNSCNLFGSFESISTHSVSE